MEGQQERRYGGDARLQHRQYAFGGQQQQRWGGGQSYQRQQHQRQYGGGGQQQPQPQPQQQQQQQQQHRRPHASSEWCTGAAGNTDRVWYQPESPPPAGASTYGFYICARCGARGHRDVICRAPNSVCDDFIFHGRAVSLSSPLSSTRRTATLRRRLERRRPRSHGWSRQ